MLSQIGIDNPNDTADIINTLSHKKVYYYESDRLVPDRRQMFDPVLTKASQRRYNFSHCTPTNLMNDDDQKQLGRTLWNIADQLRGAMNADDFRDYMLSFLFLRYLSDNYEAAAKKELGSDYPKPEGGDGTNPRSSCGMPGIPAMWLSSRSKCAARCIMSLSPISIPGPHCLLGQDPA